MFFSYVYVGVVLLGWRCFCLVTTFVHAQFFFPGYPWSRGFMYLVPPPPRSPSHALAFEFFLLRLIGFSALAYVQYLADVFVLYLIVHGF